MSKTQQEAIKKLTKSGRVQTLRDEVLLQIQSNPGLSRREVADILDAHLNSVTARIAELIRLGEVVEYSSKIDEQTGMRVALVWDANSPEVAGLPNKVQKSTDGRRVLKLLEQIRLESEANFNQVMNQIEILYSFGGKGGSSV